MVWTCFVLTNSVVLLCVKEGAWKIADFGLASDGTSKKLHTTRDGRGTPCYRAPEFIQESACYNNKVDIWSLGCILCIRAHYGVETIQQ